MVLNALVVAPATRTPWKIHNLEVLIRSPQPRTLTRYQDEAHDLQPNSPCRRYLAYQQHSPRFTLSALLSGYGKCLEKMRQLQADQARPHRPPPGLDEFMLDVLTQLCKVRACDCGVRCVMWPGEPCRIVSHMFKCFIPISSALPSQRFCGVVVLVDGTWGAVTYVT